MRYDTSEASRKRRMGNFFFCDRIDVCVCIGSSSSPSSLTYDCSLDAFFSRALTVNIPIQPKANSTLTEQSSILSRPYVLESEQKKERPKEICCGCGCVRYQMKESFHFCLRLLRPPLLLLTPARDVASFLISLGEKREETWRFLFKIPFIAMSIFSAVISERFASVSIRLLLPSGSWYSISSLVE